LSRCVVTDVGDLGIVAVRYVFHGERARQHGDLLDVVEVIVPGAGHVDLYDRVEMIPFGKLTDFVNKNLG
jgi:hypothetical protein